MSYTLTRDLTDSFTSAENVPEVYGGPRTIDAITAHHWGIDGQSFDGVVRFFKSPVETSAHEVIEAGRVALLVEHDDAAWHAGNKEGNRTTIGLELRPEATDGDYETAAQRIADIRAEHGKYLPLIPHSDWKPTQCPGRWDLDRLDKLAQQKQGTKISVSKEATTVSKWSSPLPKSCRFTSGFGKRWGTLHAGADYGPPKPGQSGVPVYAVHSGTILATGYGYGRSSDRIPYHSGRFVWQDIGTHGGDRMRIYYGHLASVNVKSGQKVTAGQKVGVMGGSGSSGENHFATHLHIGVAQNHNKPVNAASRVGSPGWINPVPWLKSKGITVGSTAPAKASSTPSSTPTASKSPSGAGQGEWPTYPLVVDGKFWLMTKRAYQRLLEPSSVGNYQGWIDGDIGPLTVKAEQRWLKNHGYYKGWIDGDRGPVTIKALQRLLRDRSFYGGIIDGKFQTLSIKGLQKLMNSQQHLYK